MARRKHKYIFVVGGVMSGVGKGIATSSLAKILQGKGFSVNPIKIDPYLNVDAGTMNPTEHGEVFVLDSGLETDQDMGNYERFLDTDLRDDDYMTGGMVYKSVIDRERSMGYRGKCVESIPHITDEVIRRIHRAADNNGSAISVIEIGGTVGEYQNVLFIEAARILKLRHPGDVMFVLVSFLPVPSKVGEMKTKPTQYAVRTLNSYGVQPDIIFARSDRPIDRKRKEKLAITCNISADDVISAPDVESVYDVPLNFEHDDVGTVVLGKLGLHSPKRTTDLTAWRRFVAQTKRSTPPVKIAIVGKYFSTGDYVLSDSYISVIEAIKYSAYKEGMTPEITWLDSEDFEKRGARALKSMSHFDGIIIPGGFGGRGIEGKINVIRYAREKQIPYLGLCYGMQLLVIEFARHVAGIKKAHTAEIEPDAKEPVVDIMADQKIKLARGNFGGSMRLGVYPAILKKGTLAYDAYKKTEISERHRHRFEINPEFVPRIEAAGLVFSGTSPNGLLMEIAELPRKDHPFFVGTQFHPEFKARPLSPHPLFTSFIKACINKGGAKKTTK
ncbi:MAG: CTP synthetase [Candidatus Lloydbacteria bacterium CG22_combo_CG10-13_8_21_14_all_47_15]|uniref:CTP synthase n=1 Tax=Candidatus Lloydbacteria bacterium CG22_combo_CG10-13_8_21_14_all_47_15 TaxID=1974635 RepID=A0A2H0CT80_9BACT|nr:MAG: CTP synthetase [Candidatus Lloydbacteria bacterium CG22_combo_CG10-13_8_21_14_all_47_15]